MRVVLLTAHSEHGGVQHRYVASRIAREFPDELAAIIVATGVQRSLGEKLRRWRKRYSPRQIGSRLLARGYRSLTRADERQQHSYRAVLFPKGENGRFARPDLIRLVPSHNAAECLALLQELKPDIVVVYGTLIIGRKVIAASPRIINLHTGYSPIYRGADTIFWPLHNGEPENLGVTVHRLDAGVDSGAILARGKPAIERRDDEDRLFAKAVKLGAELLCRAIRREFDGTAQPLVQQLEQGREYRSVDRSLAAELRVRRLLKNNLLSEARQECSEEY